MKARFYLFHLFIHLFIYLFSKQGCGSDQLLYLAGASGSKIETQTAGLLPEHDQME